MTVADPITERRTRMVLKALLAVVVLCGAVSMVTDMGGESSPPMSSSASDSFDQPIDRVDLDIDRGKVSIEAAGDAIDVQYDTYYVGQEPQRHHEISGRTLSMGYTGCGQNDCWIDYTVTVPVDTTVHVAVTDGEIFATGLSGGQTLTTEFGDIRSERSTGPVTVVADIGNVYLDDVTGDVDVEVDTGHVELSRVFGDIRVTGGGNGVTGTEIRADLVDVVTSDAYVDLTFATAPETVDVVTDTATVTIRLPADGQTYRVAAECGGEETTQVDVTTSAVTTRTVDVSADGCHVEYH